MTFYTGKQFPDERATPSSPTTARGTAAEAGYCVTRVLFEHGHPYGELIYVNFLTSEGKVLGRPVDVVVAPDGSLLISDDEAAVSTA